MGTICEPKNFSSLATIIGAFLAGPGAAHADAPQFPDLGSYTPVNTQDYVIALPNTGRAPLNMV